MMEINKADSEKIFQISGDLDNRSMQEFSDTIERELALKEDLDFVLDMDKAEFIDSGCLGVISLANRELTARGRKLRLINVHGGVASTLYVTSLEKILDIQKKKK